MADEDLAARGLKIQADAFRTDLRRELSEAFNALNLARDAATRDEYTFVVTRLVNVLTTVGQALRAASALDALENLEPLLVAQGVEDVPAFTPTRVDQVRSGAVVLGFVDEEGVVHTFTPDPGFARTLATRHVGKDGWWRLTFTDGHQNESPGDGVLAVREVKS